ncbi:MAG: hypothetical protein WD557_07975 [Dehalococcoidia bacterium]
MAARALAAPGPVRLALYADAAFELIVAVLLAVWASTWADLFNVDEAIIWLAALVFLMAALGVGLIAVLQVEVRELVYSLAGANIAGGVVLWAFFAILRDDFDPGAQWAIAAVADSFILIGLLEILALRRSPTRDE